MEQKIEEHEILEAQFTSEHEEEVRALRQQKQQLIDQLSESKEHFENILESQDEQVSNGLTRESAMLHTVESLMGKSLHLVNCSLSNRKSIVYHLLLVN